MNLNCLVWTVSHDIDRWDQCNNIQVCTCLEFKKFIFCKVNGSLNRDLKIPWDAEVL